MQWTQRLKSSKTWIVIVSIVTTVIGILALVLRKPKSVVHELAEREKEIDKQIAEKQQEKAKEVNESIAEFKPKPEPKVPETMEDLRKRYDDL